MHVYVYMLYVCACVVYTYDMYLLRIYIAYTLYDELKFAFTRKIKI